MSYDSREYDYLLKIVLVGDSKVGKTQIFNHWVYDKFENDFKPTIGIDFGVKVVSQNNTRIKLQIWDTAGQERFKTITTAYYKGSVGILLVFDICDRLSFNNLDQHLSEIKSHVAEDTPILLLGNKVDCESRREICIEEAQSFAEKHQLKYVEVSAKTRGKMAFEDTFVKQCLDFVQKQQEINRKSSDNTSVNLDSDDNATLNQKIDDFLKLHGSHETAGQIGEFLKKCISQPASDRQKFVEENLYDLQRTLNSLRWTAKSMFNTVVNFVVSILLAISIVGFPIAYCTGLLAKNQKETGHSCMFFRFGEYQASKAQSNEVFAEMNVSCRV